ncbi:MAG: hypothetical protein JKY37_34265 [Nannocystaceae bacterium]|nr:hypothetical protein [Nannocystaceae bacterium]
MARSTHPLKSPVVGVVAYILLLQAAYKHQIQPLFSNMGFSYRDLSIPEHLVIWILALVPLLTIPERLKRPSVLVVWFIYLLVYIPSLLVPPHTVDLQGSAAALPLVLALAMLMLTMTGRLPLLNHDPGVSSRRGNDVFKVCVGISVVFLYGVVFSSFDLSRGIPSLEDVYDVRLEYRDAVAQQGRLAAYAVPWTASVLNPLLLVLALRSRRPYLAVLPLVGQLAIFSFTGFKSVLFSAALLVGIVAAARSRRAPFGLWALWGSNAIVAVGLLEPLLLGSNAVAVFLVRRLLLVPGLLTGYYVEYYSQHGFSWYGHGLLKGVFSASRYTLSPPKVIGHEYFGSVAINANASLWADGYANLGFVGVFVMTGALMGLLWMFDSFSQRTDPATTAALLGIPALSLTNAALPTCIVTHGFWLALLFAYLLPSQYRSGRRGRSSSPRPTDGAAARTPT